MQDLNAVDLMEIFKWAYNSQESDFEMLETLQKTYDNEINSKYWPTESEIPIATAFTSVQKSLGDIWQGMFPNMNFIKLTANERGVTQEQIRNAEFAIQATISRKMKLKTEALYSLINCLKSGIGYGIVEPTVITPAESRIITAGTKTSRQMRIANPKRTIRYRDINVGSIVPYPSGCSFNGSKATEMSFFLDFYGEWEFKEMYEKQPAYGEDVAMKGSADDIIKQVRDSGVMYGSSLKEVIETMGGRKIPDRRQATSNKIPIKIPVVKCYMPKRHVWVVPVSKPVIIYDESEKYQTLRVPLIKWDAYPDSDKWFGMNAAKADNVRGTAYNVWFNFMFDAMTWMANRNLIYSDKAFNKKAPELMPGVPIGVPSDDVGKAAKWLDPPRIDVSAMQFGGVIQGIGDDIHGQSDLTQKNYSRGGAMAFQELVNSAKGRDILTMTILETMGLQDIIEQAMIYMQINAEEAEIFRMPVWNRTSREEETQEKTVTADDLVHSFSVALDLGAKRRYGGMESQEKFAIYDRFKDRPDINREELDRLLTPDDIMFERLHKSREEMEMAQLEDRIMQLQSGGPQQQQGTSIEQQAAQGAELGGMA